MARFKPLLASLGTIAIAMGLLFAWSLWRKNDPRPRANAANAAPAANTGGIEIEQVVLDPRPWRDPPELWPGDGQRLSSPEFWVMWETQDFSQCRLLATRDEKLWFDAGRSGGRLHYLTLDLARFDSRVTFAVDFEHEGVKYRSRPRTVSFGRGAHFDRRSHSLAVGGQTRQSLDLFLRGRDPARMPRDSFRHGWFAGVFDPWYQPQSGTAQGGTVTLIIPDPARVPQGDTVGWLQVYDEIADSRDRVLIFLRK
ncbi:MAG: hypothetical protein HS108_05795 [Planctomycetes bacterium]|nr:hypothetical protein [Planctomycetota bacterium]